MERGLKKSGCEKGGRFIKKTRGKYGAERGLKKGKRVTSAERGDYVSIGQGNNKVKDR